MATVILFVPGITAAKAKQSAWLVPLFLPVLTGFTTLWTAWKLGRRFPQNTLVQYSGVLLGKAAGKVVAGAYTLFFLILNVLVIREFSQFLTLTLLPRTPAYILNVAIVLVGCYTAALQLENQQGKRTLKMTIYQKQMVYNSKKYAEKQKKERELVLAKARDLIAHPGKYTRATSIGAAGYIKNIKFVKETGEIPDGINLSLNLEKITEEEKYDGYYSNVYYCTLCSVLYR